MGNPQWYSLSANFAKVSTVLLQVLSGAKTQVHFALFVFVHGCTETGGFSMPLFYEELLVIYYVPCPVKEFVCKLKWNVSSWLLFGKAPVLLMHMQLSATFRATLDVKL